MTAGRTYLLFSNAGTGAEAGAEDSSQLAYNTDAEAICQVHAANGTPTISLQIQGRLRQDLPWVTLATVATGDLNSDDTAVTLVRQYPFMRVNVTQNVDTTAGNLTVTVMN